MWISDVVFRGLKLVSRLVDKTRYFTKNYRFIDRRKGLDKLIIIVAGYQDFVWEKTLNRINDASPKDCDVCVVSPGIYRTELEKWCDLFNWSYLYCRENKLAQGQNTAIKLHENARMIFKLDEDIFVGKKYFEDLINAYEIANSQGVYRVGMMCPLINVNGAAYRQFLINENILDEYETLFGTARITCDDDAIYSDPRAAVFMWEHTLPLNETIERYRNAEETFFPAAVRFSIGAILFSRDTWEKAGCFKVAAEGQLAWEELEICNFCFNKSYTILIANNVFAGHLGFGKQKSVMRDFFTRNMDRF